MKLLVATPWHAPEGGGLENYAHEIDRRLVARGHEVRAVAFTRGAPGEEKLDGVRLLRVAPTAVASNTPVGARHVALLAREARDADVVVGHSPVPFAMECAALAARLRRKPFVACYHAGALVGGSRVLDLVAAVHRRSIERAALASARALVAVSPFVARGPLAAFAGKTTIIPPGVDAAFFRPDRARREAERALFVAPLDRAYRWKGWDVAYEAFRRVAAERPGARLAVVGDGDRRAEAEARARADGLAERVLFLGRLPAGALAVEYARAAVVVVASTSPAESFGMVAAEANAAGAAVVASRVGGVPDFVRDGENGVLVPPGDAAALADALLALFASPERALALGARGRSRVAVEHGWDRLTERAESVFSRLRHA